MMTCNLPVTFPPFFRSSSIMSLFFASGFNGYGELGVGHRRQCSKLTPVSFDSSRLNPLSVSLPWRLCKETTVRPALITANGSTMTVACVTAGPDATYCLLTTGTVLKSGGSNGSDFFVPVERLRKKPVIGIAATAMELVAITFNTLFLLPSRPDATLRTLHLPHPQRDHSFASVVGGTLFAVVLCRGGTVYTCGLNTYGQLGIGSADTNLSRDESLQEVTFPGLCTGERIVSVHCGGGCHALAATSHGRIFGWGNNTYGQLGLGAGGVCEVVASPQLVPFPLSTANNDGCLRSICCGDYHSIILWEHSAHRVSLFVAGRNHCGQLTPWVILPIATNGKAGVGQQAPHGPIVNEFLLVPLPRYIPPIHSAAAGGGHGSSHSVLVDVEGSAWMFGSNSKGQLGGDPVSLPVNSGDERDNTERVDDAGGATTTTTPQRETTTPGVLVSRVYANRGLSVRAAAGWRTTFLYPAGPLEESVGSTTTSAATSAAMDALLPPDVLDYIVQFLSLTEAKKLLSVSRVLNETVRYCWPVWRGVVSAKCACSASMAQQEAQRRQQQGEVVAIDWLTLYANHRRVRLGQLTPFPIGVSPDEAHAGDVKSSTLSRVASAVRGAFETSSTRFRRIFDSLFSCRSGVRLLMSGLDAAGKTTILYKLKLGEIVTTIPTIGFNVETITYKHLDFICWDVGGPDKIRPLWRHYYQDTRARIMVVDSNDHYRLAEAARECRKQCSEPELLGVPLLILANKQDLPGALNIEDIAHEFNKEEGLPGMWSVQGCIATTGEGVYEGLDWLAWAVDHPIPRPQDSSSENSPDGRRE